MNAEPNAELDVEIESVELSGASDKRSRRGGIVALITLFAAVALVAGLVISRSPDTRSASASGTVAESPVDAADNADDGADDSMSEDEPSSVVDDEQTSESAAATDAEEAAADSSTEAAPEATMVPALALNAADGQTFAATDVMTAEEIQKFREAIQEAARTAAVAAETAAEADRLKAVAATSTSGTASSPASSDSGTTSSPATSDSGSASSSLTAEQATQAAAQAAANQAAQQAAIAAAEQAAREAAIAAAEAAAEAERLAAEAALREAANPVQSVDGADAIAPEPPVQIAPAPGQIDPPDAPVEVILPPGDGVVDCITSPCCYVAPGAADEPAWWCDGQLCNPNAPHNGCPGDSPGVDCLEALPSSSASTSGSSSSSSYPPLCWPEPNPLPAPTPSPVCLQELNGSLSCPPECTGFDCEVIPAPPAPCAANGQSTFNGPCLPPECYTAGNGKVVCEGEEPAYEEPIIEEPICGFNDTRPECSVCIAIYPPPPDCLPACLGSPAGPNEIGGCPTPEPLPLPVCNPLDDCFPPCSAENPEGCLVDPVPEPLPEPAPCAPLDQPLTVCITPLPEPQPLPICDGTQTAPTPGDCIKPPPTATSVPLPVPTATTIPLPPPTEVPLPAPAPEVGFNAGDYVGLSVGAAESVAAANGFTTRIGRIDGEWFALTMDFRTDRVTFEVDNGIVTSVHLG